MFAQITIPAAVLGSVCLGTSVTMAENGAGQSLRDSTRDQGHSTLNGVVGGPVFAFGIAHDPVGGAVVTGSGGPIKIMNLGSTGKDGVCMPLPPVKSMSMKVQGLPEVGPGTFYVDSFFDIAYRIEFNNDPLGLDAEVLSLEQLGSCDNSSLLVETFLGGQPVDSAVVLNPAVGQALVVSNIGSSGKDGVRISLGGGDSEATVDSFFDIVYAVDQNGFIVGNQPAGPIDEIRVTHLSCACLPLDCDPLNPAAGLRAANIPQLIITEESLSPFAVDSFFDIAYECVALGDAHYQIAVSEGLAMDNLGSSGKDGVRVSLGDLDPGDSNWPCALALDLDSAAPDGTWSVDSFFDITYRIDFSGGSGAISYIGPCDASSDSETLVELTLDGNVVASELFPPGASGQPLAVSNLGSSGKDGVRVNLGGSSNQLQVDSFFDIVYTVVDPQARILNGSAPVAANGIRITVLDCPGGSPPQGPGLPSTPQYISLRSTMPTLGLRNIQHIPLPALPCPADCAPDNGDGTFG
ncbi:MAG: hypothetical protein KC983_09215, partial [Phycisphaerales bacterium]|nr:hypothetical protein [Phycisphaerales bacterium]